MLVVVVVEWCNEGEKTNDPPSTEKNENTGEDYERWARLETKEIIELTGT